MGLAAESRATLAKVLGVISPPAICSSMWTLLVYRCCSSDTAMPEAGVPQKDEGRALGSSQPVVATELHTNRRVDAAS